MRDAKITATKNFEDEYKIVLAQPTMEIDWGKAIVLRKKLDDLTNSDLDSLSTQISNCTKVGPLLAVVHLALENLIDLVAPEAAQQMQDCFQHVRNRVGVELQDLEAFSPEVRRQKLA